MRRPSLLALALVLLLPLVAPLRAQAPVDSGARVRVVAPAVRGTYWVLAATPDTLVLQRDPTAPVHRVPVAAIERLDVNRGRRSTAGGLGRGLLVGAGVGAGLGIAIGLASGDDDPGSFFTMSAEEKALGGGLVLGLGGGVVGGLIGALAPGERWERVAPARLAIVTPPTGRGVGVRLAGAF